jgi:hypothetical protein
VPEKQIQAAIVRLLRMIGAHVYVLGTRRRAGDHPGTMQTPGIADLFVLLPAPPLARPVLPLALWIEVKAPRGRVSAAQIAFADQCLAAGIPYLRGGIDEVIDYLTGFGWLKREHPIPQ